MLVVIALHPQMFLVHAITGGVNCLDPFYDPPPQRFPPQTIHPWGNILFVNEFSCMGVTRFCVAREYICGCRRPKTYVNDGLVHLFS